MTEKASLHLYASLGLQDGSACGAHFLSASVRPTCVIARNGSSTRTTNVGVQGNFNSPRVQEGIGRGSFHYAGERRPPSPQRPGTGIQWHNSVVESERVQRDPSREA
jgi:hypothetical protein